MVQTTELRKHPHNPNYHPKVQIDALCEVIIENGWRSPVVVSNLSGLVIKGHGRIAAAERLGVAVPVVYQDYPDEAAEIRDLIADNKIQELSQLDNKAVSALVSKFKLSGGLGFVRSHTGAFAKSLQAVKDRKPAARKFPILILESEEEYQMFEAVRARLGAKSDGTLFGKILRRAFSQLCGDDPAADQDTTIQEGADQDD